MLEGLLLTISEFKFNFIASLNYKKGNLSLPNLDLEFTVDSGYYLLILSSSNPITGFKIFGKAMTASLS